MFDENLRSFVAPHAARHDTARHAAQHGTAAARRRVAFGRTNPPTSASKQCT